MINLAAFVNGFLEYLIVFLVFGATIIVAFLIGMNVRKAKNKKEAVLVADTTEINESNK